MDIVWEETLLVEDGGQSLGASLDGHWLSMLILVHLDNGI